MKYRLYLPVFIAVLISACAIKTTSNGLVIHDVSFQVDQGKTISLPMTRGGALPSETEDYKITGADYFGELKKGSQAESGFTMNFSFRAKNAKYLEYVRIEQVLAGGKLTLVLEDNSPVLNNGSWNGKSALIPATKEMSSWLYENGNSTFLFKFTIKAKNEPNVEIYQPSLFSKETKAVYLQVMGVR